MLTSIIPPAAAPTDISLTRVHAHPDTTLIVLADHETGGLTDECQYTTKNHTGVDIPLHAYGKHAKLFEGEQDNTEIYKKMKEILFSEN